MSPFLLMCCGDGRWLPHLCGPACRLTCIANTSIDKARAPAYQLNSSTSYIHHLPGACGGFLPYMLSSAEGAVCSSSCLRRRRSIASGGARRRENIGYILATSLLCSPLPPNQPSPLVLPLLLVPFLHPPLFLLFSSVAPPLRFLFSPLSLPLPLFSHSPACLLFRYFSASQGR